MAVPETPNRFEAAQTQQSLPREFWEYLRENKKFWLIPILAVFLVFGVLMLLGGSAAAPFIYTLF